VLAGRFSVTPRSDWGEERYVKAAARKRRRGKRLIRSLKHWCGRLDGATVLDAGCGDGINCLLLALQPVRQVVGIDLDLPLLAPTERGEQVRELAARVLNLPPAENLDAALARLPLRFEQMDVTRMAFPNESFDAVLSRSAMEHFSPVEKALSEMVRVLRLGGILYLSIDPYYWLRGCHKRGVVDIPWAHARLSIEEFRRFVANHEGEEEAAKRSRRLETLNRFTVREWRTLAETTGCEILDWQVSCAPLAVEVLREHPEIETTLLAGVQREDLIHAQIHGWLRKKD
jgi:SAM-dependent methyltransferase